MKTPRVAVLSSWIRRGILALLALLALPLTACNAPRHVYNLSTVAIESVDEASRPALKLQTAHLIPGDHTKTNLQRAADQLAKANAEAPTSAQARAAQALIIDTLPENAYLTSSYAPELNRQLGIAFDQADQRMKACAGEPDLMTAIVWARSGIAANRVDQLCAAIQRAADDPQLRSVLRKDDQTRDQLWTYLTSMATRDRQSESVLYRGRDMTPGDVANGALTIVALPVLVITLALGGVPNC